VCIIFYQFFWNVSPSQHVKYPKLTISEYISSLNNHNFLILLGNHLLN